MAGSVLLLVWHAADDPKAREPGDKPVDSESLQAGLLAETGTSGKAMCMTAVSVLTRRTVSVLSLCCAALGAATAGYVGASWAAPPVLQYQQKGRHQLVNVDALQIRACHTADWLLYVKEAVPALYG
jgi:hypothetical protein